MADKAVRDEAVRRASEQVRSGSGFTRRAGQSVPSPDPREALKIALASVSGHPLVQARGVTWEKAGKMLDSLHEQGFALAAAGREAGGEDQLTVEEATAAADWIRGHRPSRDDEARVGRLLDLAVRKLRSGRPIRGAGYSEADVERVAQVLIDSGTTFQSRLPVGRRQRGAFARELAEKVLAVLRGPEREAEADGLTPDQAHIAWSALEDQTYGRDLSPDEEAALNWLAKRFPVELAVPGRVQEGEEHGTS